MLSIFKIINKKLWPALYQLVGSFIISASWNWYHTAYRPHWRWAVIVIGEFVFIFLFYQLAKLLYRKLVKRFNRHVFWQTEFYRHLDQLFMAGSLFFLVLFSRWELISLFYVLFWLFFIYWFSKRCLTLHPVPLAWLQTQRVIFILAVFLFIILSVFQYTAYKLYIFDINAKYYNIVLFRVLAITMLWLLIFAVGNLLSRIFKRSRWRHIFLVCWALLFIFILIIWLVNIGVVYFSGLFFSPTAIEHVGNSAGVVFNWLTILLAVSGVVTIGIFGLILRLIIKNHQPACFRQWNYYTAVLIFLSLLSLLFLGSFRNTPEHIIFNSFYNYWHGDYKSVELSQIVKDKLIRFGLDYKTNDFAIAYKDNIFSSQDKLLPTKFNQKKPNIMVIFLESFSSQLTGVYNNKLKDVTPGLNKMASDKNTTIFKNFYNASTPTITGLLAQLCSFLPPTGHNEIEVEKRVQRIFLSCLPDILKNQGGYKYTNYVTAVNKDFANKGSIFKSMGTDEIYGTEELSKLIFEKPLSWGYSDHQLFPVFWQIIEKNTKEPFFAMLSTVDTHPPFDLAKDGLNYKDGKSVVLNAVYSTDDAFDKFWNKFKNSQYYQNTILIAVADHAIFPGQSTKEVLGKNFATYYDENVFLMYVPDSILPQEISAYSSNIDFAPTILHLLNINTDNVFDGHSIFGDRQKYPNLLGMHEFGLYINQLSENGKRQVSYNLPSELKCVAKDFTATSSSPLTACEFLEFYKWKRRMFEDGRLWMR